GRVRRRPGKGENGSTTSNMRRRKISSLNPPAALVAAEARRYDVSYERAARATNADERSMDRAELERELQALHADSFAWALACCDRDRDDAEDVLQTVYVKIFDGKARFEARASFKTWLFAVIRRTASSHRRMRWFRALRFVERNCDEHESIEQNLVRSERAAALVHGLAQLARRQRAVLDLVLYHDMNVWPVRQVP